ncbi:hypothetical protein CEXT_624791 [Caerostris extrusa]|uniref:Uncharacterized protein n=1 Tax=Caerostris extrusa TaxID=172846 RepID=A0AAV4XZ13_CAEEX|nr:hypothetical protein CEXT_624791 [Caerostris extrusa]
MFWVKEMNGPGSGMRNPSCRERSIYWQESELKEKKTESGILQRKISHFQTLRWGILDSGLTNQKIGKKEA